MPEMTESLGVFALLCSVGAIVFGAVRFHRARAALGDATQGRRDQLMAEVAALAEMAANTAEVPEAPEVDETESPAEAVPNSVRSVDPELRGDDGVESVIEPEIEDAVESEVDGPPSVEREMDAFFGAGLPVLGTQSVSEVRSVRPHDS